MLTAETIKTGDTVRHVPSGETWTVAYVKAEDDVLAWCGWPAGQARLSDCELVEACSEAESRALLAELAAMPGDDQRKSYALAFLRAAEAVAALEGDGADGR